MKSSHLKDAIDHLKALLLPMNFGPIAGFCPFPNCESTNLLGDGIYTICENGHVCGQGDKMCSMGIEKDIYVVLEKQVVEYLKSMS